MLHRTHRILQQCAITEQKEGDRMNKRRFLRITIIAVCLITAAALLTVIHRSLNSYQDFAETVTDGKGSYHFRSLKMGMSLEEIIQSEQLDRERLLYWPEKNAEHPPTYIQYMVPIYFESLDTAFYCIYYLKSDYLVMVEYSASFDKEESFQEACSHIIRFAERWLPKNPSNGSMGLMIPREGKLLSAPQWEDTDPSGNRLSILLQDRTADAAASIRVIFQ